jgi:hypothetical protein
MSKFYSKHDKIILKILSLILCNAFFCFFVGQAFALSSKIVFNSAPFQDAFLEFPSQNLEHALIPALPQQDIFRRRIATALENGTFDAIFGKKVAYVGIEEIGNSDKHLLLEPRVLRADVDGISIDLSHLAISFDNMDAVFQDTRARVFGFDFWKKKGDEVVETDYYYLGRVDRVPLSSSWEEDLNSKIDYFGRVIVRRLLQGTRNEYIIDFTRKLLFKDEQGNIIPLIYKPFSAVLSEKAASEIIRTLGYEHTVPIHVLRDDFGDYAFVEYIIQKQMNGKKIYSEKQARMLGRLLPIFYMLGFSDLTFDNILLSENGDLVPIDVEAIFWKEFSRIESFSKFEKTYREYGGELLGGNKFLLMPVGPKGDFRQAYLEGIQESMLQIMNQEKELKQDIHALLTNKEVKTRVLFADTGEYGEDLTLRGIVPYYLVPIVSEENKNLEKEAFYRIDELVAHAKTYQVVQEPLVKKAGSIAAQQVLLAGQAI